MQHAKAIEFQGFAGLYFKVLNDSSTVEVTHSYNAAATYSGIMTIPSEVAYNGKSYPVVAIGDNAFQGCHRISRIDLPNSIKSIGTNAFDGCYGVSIYLNDNVESIANNSFDKNAKLFTGFSKLLFMLWKNGYKKSYNKETGELIELNVGIEPKNVTLTSATVSLSGNLYDGLNYYVQNNIGNQMDTVTHYVSDANRLAKVLVNPFKSQYVYAYVELKDKSEKYQVAVKSIDAPTDINPWKATTTASSIKIEFTGVPDSIVGDATYKLDSLQVRVKDSKTNYYPDANRHRIGLGQSFILNGLTPENEKLVWSTIEIKYTYRGWGYTNPGYYNEALVDYNVYYSTEKLTLTTGTPKVISDGNVIVQATSNLDDDETNVGFEYRRTDWTDDFDSRTGKAYLYNGAMEGYIRSLNSKYLWKYRPYYESNDGTRYYGEWKGIDPSDVSYYEPTVHTYASINVSGNDATIKGYVQRGSDNVTSQGFFYWRTGSGNSSAKAYAPSNIPNDAQKVEVSGTVMETTLAGLQFNSTYAYVAFVTTSEGETFYGDQRSFVTGSDPTGIVAVKDGPSNVRHSAGIYDLSGRKHGTMQRGINIVRFEDGTVKKVIIR